MKTLLALALMGLHAGAPLAATTPSAATAPSAAPRLLEESPQAAAPAEPGLLYFGPERIFPKDPHAALAFSLLCPGLGHVYDESYGRGALAFALFGAGVGFLANNGRLVASPNSNNERRLRNPTAFQIGAPLVLAWYLLVAQDARAQARRYNKKLGFRFAVQARGPSVDFIF